MEIGGYLFFCGTDGIKQTTKAADGKAGGIKKPEREKMGRLPPSMPAEGAEEKAASLLLALKNKSGTDICFLGEGEVLPDRATGRRKGAAG